jgi:hypothetical protein
MLVGQMEWPAELKKHTRFTHTTFEKHTRFMHNIDTMNQRSGGVNKIGDMVGVMRGAFVENLTSSHTTHTDRSQLKITTVSLKAKNHNGPPKVAPCAL